MNNRCYSELRKLKTFKERYEYLRLLGTVGEDTFGFDRYLNQNFYRSSEWKRIRNQIIVRDNGCDMGLDGYNIGGRILVHHMNPISIEDIQAGGELILDPEFLVCVSHETHNAIHYGYDYAERKEYVPRRPNDTTLWRKAT